MITEAQVRRINEIPLKVIELKKQKQYAARRGWLGAAAMQQKRIDELEAEQRGLYGLLGKE